MPLLPRNLPRKCISILVTVSPFILWQNLITMNAVYTVLKFTKDRKCIKMIYHTDNRTYRASTSFSLIFFYLIHLLKSIHSHSLIRVLLPNTNKKSTCIQLSCGIQNNERNNWQKTLRNKKWCVFMSWCIKEWLKAICCRFTKTEAKR